MGFLTKHGQRLLLHQRLESQHDEVQVRLLLVDKPNFSAWALLHEDRDLVDAPHPLKVDGIYYAHNSPTAGHEEWEVAKRSAVEDGVRLVDTELVQEDLLPARDLRKRGERTEHDNRSEPRAEEIGRHESSVGAN